MTTARIYLDHAAATPLLPEARAAMLAGHDGWANPSSPHREGRAARRRLEEARGRIAAALGWPHALIFTSGASEAARIALRRAYGQPAAIVSAVEHAAVRGARADAVELGVEASGLVDHDRLARLLAEQPGAIVAIQHVNSETGVIQPLAELAAIVRAGGGRLFVDAAQSAGKLPLPEADMIAVSAHKLGGPPGVGALLVRDLALIDPAGQGQEQGYRPGTENLPGALGFAAALEALPAGWAQAFACSRARLDAAVRSAGGAVIAEETPRSPLIASYRLPGLSAAAQLMRLDGAGFAVSAGSACSSGSMRASPVLRAMGLDEAAAGEVLRVSFGPETTAGEVEAFIAAWRALADESRRRAA